MSVKNTISDLSAYINLKYKDFSELLKNVCCSKLPNINNRSGVIFIVPNDSLVKKYLKISADLMEDEELQNIRSFCRKHFLIGDLENTDTNSVGNIDNYFLDVSRKGSNISLKGSGIEEIKLEKVNVNFPPYITHKGQEFKSNVKVYKQGNSSNNIQSLEWKYIERPKREPFKPHNKDISGGSMHSLDKFDEMIRFLYTQNLKYTMKKQGKNTIDKSVLEEFNNPYLAAMNSLFLYIKTVNINLYYSLLLLKDVSPEVNFYMFVEPFNKPYSTEYSNIISDTIISEWKCTLFDYKPNTFNYYLDLDVYNFINGNAQLKQIANDISMKKDVYTNFNKYLTSVPYNNGDFSSGKNNCINNDTALWCDFFRTIFRKRFADALNSPDPGHTIALIATDIKNNFSGKNKRIDAILPGKSLFNNSLFNKPTNTKPLSDESSNLMKQKLKDKGSLIYINYLTVYDRTTNTLKMVKSTQESLSFYPKDTDNFDYLIDGYKLADEFNLAKTKAIEAYNKDHPIDPDDRPQWG